MNCWTDRRGTRRWDDATLLISTLICAYKEQLKAYRTHIAGACGTDLFHCQQMALLSWLLSVLLPVVVFLLVGSYLYTTRHFSFWKRLGVPYMKPVPFIGNTGAMVLGRRNVADVLWDAYREAGDQPYLGVFIYDNPVLVIKDVDLVGRVLVSDFSSFIDRNIHTDEGQDPLTNINLFAGKGEKWRRLRTKMSAVFTTGRVKRMLPVLRDVGDMLVEHINDAMKRNGFVDVVETSERFTTDTSGSTIMGIEPTALKDDNSEFLGYVSQILGTNLVRYVASVAALLAPDLVALFKLKTSNESVNMWMTKTIAQILDHRRNSGEQRGDFLDIMLQLEKEGLLGDEISQSNATIRSFSLNDSTIEIVGHALSFLLAGYDTSASTLTYALYELALNQKAQEKLRQNINEVLMKHNGEITYEAIQEMSYLTMVTAESLRLHPPLGFLDRRTDKEYAIPGTNVVLPKNTSVAISLHGLHTDPRYWDQPTCFLPERFTEENTKQRPKFLHMPFGEGPRVCIGARLGALVSKIGLLYILKNFEVFPHSTTPVHIKGKNTRIFTFPEKELPLVFKKIHSQ